MTVTKTSKIGEILDFDRGTSQFFIQLGMHCLGCPSARSETLEQACLVHGADADALVEAINGYLSANNA